MSRLTAKYQATIPSRVRKILDLQAGDSVIFDIENSVVQLRKASPIELEFSAALNDTLHEWHSKADDEAYREL
ncbi:AbrB/MazE/SpoVT family DNA-binding domain-containing protein [Haliea sp. AH-315-K21]|uniref:AbrB family transcriptional regulator n=1 Tax=SAR86 cluster bacterium TaxID=2030880 RepID=A0A2A5C9B0_9GAMM|nr:AbrB/MazE/SpoVT family DNA-binding domain-containing protein [Haliea sp. AH-315-K21]MBN4075772.1 AbrB/MazE/SpoVT family DNA-binding domain-containing protein [Gammaproteobacteria bacterium AH-315-E17]PCJ40417.1 MAG: AbrB family transcriptional regulator [SAR86 cluster bacterium]